MFALQEEVLLCVFMGYIVILVLHREQLPEYQQVLVKDVSPCSLQFCAQILKIQFSLFKDINMNRSEYVEGKVC